MKVEAWFREYLTWINTHRYGKREKHHPNNHGVCWSLQAAAFADLVGDEDQLAWIRKQFKTVYLSKMMDSNGGFPKELKRTKPYGYSLFVVDAMAGVAQFASTPEDDLWTFELPDGRGMKKGMQFIVPYIADKSNWPQQTGCGRRLIAAPYPQFSGNGWRVPFSRLFFRRNHSQE